MSDCEREKIARELCSIVARQLGKHCIQALSYKHGWEKYQIHAAIAEINSACGCIFAEHLSEWIVDSLESAHERDVDGDEDADEFSQMLSRILQGRVGLAGELAAKEVVKLVSGGVN